VNRVICLTSRYHHETFPVDYLHYAEKKNLLQVFCNLMFKYANEALSNEICTDLHIFKKNKM